MSAQSRRKLVGSFNPTEPLKPGDARYVDFEPVRDQKVVTPLVRRYRLSNAGTPIHTLFSGHRGTGKTSVLLRFKQNLEEERDGEKFFVIYANVSEVLDMADFAYQDFLVFIAAELLDNLRKDNIPGFDPTSTYFKRLYDDIKGFLLKDVNITEGELGVEGAKLTVELKNRLSAVKSLREEIQKQSSTIIRGLNDLLDNANLALKNAGYQSLVLIIDGVDVLEPGKDQEFFLHRDQLCSLKTHLVLAGPISYLFSNNAAQWTETAGCQPVVMPMISLRPARNEPVSIDSKGFGLFKEMLDKRCVSAGTTLDEVFEDENVWHYLIEMSGGHARHLMMFVQASIAQVDELPITIEAANAAVRVYSNNLLRQIKGTDWEVLRKYEAPLDEIEHSEENLELLFNLYLFEYMNGDIWFEVNPVIRALEKFRD